MGHGEDLKGYLVYYTTNSQMTEWVQESIPDDALTHRVEGLTPDTTYYFRMAARHANGVGPYTEVKSVATPASRKLHGGHSGNAKNVPSGKYLLFSSSLSTLSLLPVTMHCHQGNHIM